MSLGQKSFECEFISPNSGTLTTSTADLNSTVRKFKKDKIDGHLMPNMKICASVIILSLK